MDFNAGVQFREDEQTRAILHETEVVDARPIAKMAPENIRERITFARFIINVVAGNFHLAKMNPIDRVESGFGYYLGAPRFRQLSPEAIQLHKHLLSVETDTELSNS